jgi:cytochrome c oxidase subunit 2
MLAVLLISLVSIAAVLLFVFAPAWFPVAISPEAVLYDSQFHLNLILLGGLFVLAQVLLALSLLHKRRPSHRRGYPVVEASWAVLIALLFAFLGVTGARGWSGSRLGPAQPAEAIEVYAQQFAWHFRYTGADGKFGKTDIALINDAAMNPLGLVPGDPAGQDDVVTASLRVPVGRPVVLTLHSRDVIHDFFVRELRLKQDIVPGMDIPYRFQADRIGHFEIACAELCGLGHSQMHGLMEVMSESDYQAWKRAQIRP